VLFQESGGLSSVVADDMIHTPLQMYSDVSQVVPTICAQRPILLT
jgi:hypothetical protein